MGEIKSPSGLGPITDEHHICRVVPQDKDKIDGYYTDTEVLIGVSVLLSVGFSRVRRL